MVESPPSDSEGHPPYRTLFLCTGNSARSVLAEAILKRLGKGRFEAFSAGSHPRGEVHPVALEVLAEFGDDTGGLRSKSWLEFEGPEAPKLDFVFTVCDDAAGESCPVWPGQPVTAHWGMPDPARVDESAAEQRAAFRRTYVELEHRLRIFTSLPIDALDRLTLQSRLDEIGAAPPAANAAEPTS